MVRKKKVKYCPQGRLFNLCATNSDDAIMIKLIRVEDGTASIILLKNKDVIVLKGTLDEMIPNNKELAEIINNQLIAFGVGQGDLDPLSSPAPSGEGGMLAVPPHSPRPPRGIPAGSLPPGARFYPILPPDVDPSPPIPPDNDTFDNM